MIIKAQLALQSGCETVHVHLQEMVISACVNDKSIS